MNFEVTKKRSLRKRWLMLGAVVLGIAILSYAWYDYRFPSWKEEVLLPDGRKIVVKQKRDFIEGYGTRKTWLTFSLPEMGGEQTWVEHLMPSVVAVDQGNVYVLGMPRGPKQYSMYGGPKYFVVAFMWNGSKFQRVSVDQIPLAIRQEENVFRCLNPSPRELLSWSSKLDKWCESATTPEKISRVLDFNELEILSKKYARMNGHSNFSN